MLLRQLLMQKSTTWSDPAIDPWGHKNRSNQSYSERRMLGGTFLLHRFT